MLGKKLKSAVAAVQQPANTRSSGSHFLVAPIDKQVQPASLGTQPPPCKCPSSTSSQATPVVDQTFSPSSGAGQSASVMRGSSTCQSCTTSTDPVVIARCEVLQKKWETYVRAHNLKLSKNNAIDVDCPLFHCGEEKNIVDRRPVLVLACDGGGVRGAATAAAAAEIEKIWADEAQKLGLNDPHFIKFCNWEIFAGTSTGSFVTGMLAGCNASGEDVVAMYTGQASVMMPHKGWGASLFSSISHLFSGALYTNTGKELVLQKGFLNKTTGKQKTLKNVDEENRQLLICAYRVVNDPGMYVFDSSNIKDQNTELWQVCDASSAAPTYFSAVVVNDHTYIDGGVALNNPAVLALNAAKHRSTTQNNRPVFMISFGTGSKPANMGVDVGGAEALRDGLTDFISDCYSQALLAEEYCKTHDWNYMRINGGLGAASELMDNVSPDNLKKLIAAGRGWARSREAELRKFMRDILASEIDLSDCN